MGICISGSGTWAYRSTRSVVRKSRDLRARGGGVYWWHIRKIVKNRFPYIDTFNHEGPSVISVMRNLTIRVFEHIEITYVMDVDLSIKHTERILRGTSLKKYQHILAGCKALAKGIYGGQWSLGS